MSSYHEKVREGRGSLLRGESSRSTPTSRQPMEIPRRPGEQQPRERHSSYRDRDDDYQDDDEDDEDEDEDEDNKFHHRGSLPSTSNVPRSNSVYAASFNDQASMRSMSTVTDPYSQSYEPVSRELASRRTMYATESQDSTRADDSVPPRGLLAEFVKLPLSDFRSYAAFIDKYPEILQAPISSLQGLATQAYRVTNNDLAKRYVQLNVILHKCKSKNLEQSCQYVQDLASRSYRGNYFEALDQLVSALKKQAVPPATSPAAIAQRMQGLDVGDASRSQIMGQPARPENRQRRISGQESDQQRVYAALQNQSQPSNFSLEDARQQSYPPGRRTRSTINNLPSALGAAFQLRSSSFFVVGRVFRVLWHQPAGANLQGQLTNSTSVGKFREPIYTTARWMLVVKENNGHCVCCPISTYGGRGLHEKNYRTHNIKAHAMMYEDGTPPPQDPELNKRPIPVRTQESGNRVNSISSVNFSKLHTVEHNVKVADIGMVPERYHNSIVRYVSDEFLT